MTVLLGSLQQLGSRQSTAGTKRILPAWEEWRGSNQHKPLWPVLSRLPLWQDQKGCSGICLELFDSYRILTQYLRNVCGGAVPQPDPNHLGRSAKHQASLVEIRIFGNQRVAVALPRRPIPAYPRLRPNQHCAHVDSLERRQLEPAPADARGSDRTAASCSNRKQLALTISHEGETSPDVLMRKVGKISQDFCFRHIRSQVIQNIVYSDAHAADAGLSAHACPAQS